MCFLCAWDCPLGILALFVQCWTSLGGLPGLHQSHITTVSGCGCIMADLSPADQVKWSHPSHGVAFSGEVFLLLNFVALSFRSFKFESFGKLSPE